MGLKSILCVALNGARRQKTENPAVPISPAEIAAAAAEGAKAGAAIAHVHARSPDGQATQDPAVYAEIIRRIEDTSDIIVQISIGGLGFSVEELLQPLAIGPEMASFPLRVLHDADADPLAELRGMAARMKQHGVRPELDGGSLPMLQAALVLHAEEAFASPLCFGFVLGDVKEMPDGARRLLALRQDIPDGSHWWAMKGGAHALGLAALAVSLGGHVRTGFEDTVRDPRTGELAASNAHLIAGLADLSSRLGRDPASPQEARDMLSLRRPAIGAAASSAAPA
jgi:3-keto-5-aminohexanoate cleavage enzyme